MWNLKRKKMIQVNSFSKTEIDPQTQKTNLWLPDRKGGGINQEFGIDRHTAIYKTDKQGPTVQHKELYTISCNNL